MNSSQGVPGLGRRSCLLIVFLCMMLAACPVLAQDEGRLAGADAVIARAVEMKEQGDAVAAISYLKSALDRYPTYGPLYLALAGEQQARGIADPANVAALLDTCGLGALHLRDDRELHRRVQALVSARFPQRLGPYGNIVLPGTPIPFTFRIRDPRLFAFQRGLQQGMITMTPLDTGTAYRYDPKYHTAKYAGDAVYGGWTFQRMIYAYLYDRSQQCWMLRFRVIWQDVAGQDEARLQLARQTAQLLLQLSGLLSAYTGDQDSSGMRPRFADDGAVNVWLTEKGEAGGEAYNENIYIYNVGTPRSPAEWVRELAHEYGHQVFKPVGGYEQPEWAASGRLGEALFMRWLALNADTDTETVAWLKSFDPEAQFARRYLPFVRQFADAGPIAPALRGTDDSAMNDFLGFALYIEMARGPEFLTGIFNAMSSPTFAGTNGFLDALENSVERKVQEALDQPVVTLRLRDLPRDIPFHVFLAHDPRKNGAWHGEFQGQDLGETKFAISFDGKDYPVDQQKSFVLASVKPGWHQLRLKWPDPARIPTLTQLKLTYVKN